MKNLFITVEKKNRKTFLKLPIVDPQECSIIVDCQRFSVYDVPPALCMHKPTRSMYRRFMRFTHDQGKLTYKMHDSGDVEVILDEYLYGLSENNKDCIAVFNNGIYEIYERVYLYKPIDEVSIVLFRDRFKNINPCIVYSWDELRVEDIHEGGDFVPITQEEFDTVVYDNSLVNIYRIDDIKDKVMSALKDRPEDNRNRLLVSTQEWVEKNSWENIINEHKNEDIQQDFISSANEYYDLEDTHEELYATRERLMEWLDFLYPTAE